MRKTALALLAALMLAGCADNAEITYGDAPIYPDYMNVTVPSTIAPLNFVWKEGKPRTEFSTPERKVCFRGKKVQFSRKEWKELIQSAKGSRIEVTASNGISWNIYVSDDEIDYGIAYRLIEPGYEVWSKMGIYERDLSSFKERPLLENTEFDGCVNCHESRRGNPGEFSLHIRGSHGATLLQTDDLLKAYNTKTDSTLGFCVYPYWHPDGNYIIYSTNTTRQSFHMQKDKLIEVFDLASDLQVYDIRNNRLITAPQVKTSDWETFPTFSPDGKTIYFCRAREKRFPEEATTVRYNLYKVSFDPETGAIGTDIECLVDAEAEGRSISFPKPSYDGRYIMFTKSDYGNFSIWHHEADLWLLDLKTGESRPIDEVNSADTESYHNWSENSRWFLFSSRRDDGLFTRIYFAHIAEDGTVGKPFMLPQKDPAKHYSTLFMSYNVPEFVSGPTPLDRRRAQKIIESADRIPFGFRWSE